HHARPFGAGAEEPAATPNQARRMECIAGNEELQALAIAQIRPDNDALAIAIGMQQKHLDRIAEIVMVELVVADAMEAHRRRGRHHEVERGTPTAAGRQTAPANHRPQSLAWL